MEKIKQLARRAVNLSSEFVLTEVYANDGSEIKELIIHLNTQSQLFEEGINSDNEALAEIGGRYKAVTVEIKRKEGLPFDWVTLFDTGEFYESFEVTFSKGDIFINADTRKGDGDLTERWGRKIIGLTNESIEELIFFLRPLIIEFIKSHLLEN